MVLIYNTFFIGQTHNDVLIAAVSLAAPVFLIFMSLGTIFGMGGSSVISRALGENCKEYASKVCSMWGCVFAGIAVSALFLIFIDQILAIIGASAETWQPAKQYLTIVAFCGPFSLIANCCTNVIRAEGKSTQAMMGQLISNLINVVLDPILILWFDWGIAGAAIATVLGNVIGALYYICYFISGKSMLSARLRDFTVKDKVFTSVMAIGIPASLGNLLMSVSQIIVNMLMAGIGVAMKVTMITGMLCIGFGQGVQPLPGYFVGAGLWDRFKKVMNQSLLYSFLLWAILTGLCYIFTSQPVNLFVSSPEAVSYGITFTRILLSTSFLFGIYYTWARPEPLCWSTSAGRDCY